MAIFKPTDCSPFNGTFDIGENSADLPIIFECKVDTSNTIVTGYSIEIYDSNNKLVFPSESNREIGPVASNVTYLSDLRPYVISNFSSLIPNMRNINSGLNGTYLEIPFYVDSVDATSGSTIPRNQMSSGLIEGQTYTWKITLYQEVKKDGDFPPKEERYYDMTVASGTVIGSNEKRIQTALIDSDDQVIDNLVLIDKFVQPIKIDSLDYSPDKPKSWSGTVPTTFSMTRSLITGYDSTYGYIYPSTAADNAFTEGQIVPENANGFQIFKNGNNPSNLGATDMVEFIYDSGEFNGNMIWKTSAAKPEQSYWEQTYLVNSDPNGVYYPLKGDYSSFALTGSERIIFNNIQNSKVQYDGIYYGSPYNGIFEPHFSSKEALNNNTIAAGTYVLKQNPSLTSNTVEQELNFTTVTSGSLTRYNKIKIDSTNISYNNKLTDGYSTMYSDNTWVSDEYRTINTESDQEVSSDFFSWFSQNIVNATPYQVTVVWNRTSDASNWGTLSNKIVYCRRDGKNYETNTATQIGEINKIPFKFVEEKPVRIFNITTAEEDKIEKIHNLSDLSTNSCIFFVNKAISSMSSIIRNDGVDVTKDCIFEIGEKDIIYTSLSALPSNMSFTVKYIPYNIQDYAGVIFYNQKLSTNSTGYLYIRPSINIGKNMIFKELTTTNSFAWFNVNYFNKDYNYIKYEIGNGNLEEDSNFNPIPDKTRYQIKSFYKDSDYNPFSIYKNPTIVSTISGSIIELGGFENNIVTRNFTVTSTYDQDNYIQWKSYQWFLYDFAKRTILEKTDEQYDGEITATFYGLDPQKYYILSLVLQTNSGKIIEIDYVIYTNFTETTEQKDLVEAEFDCDTLAMKANLKLVNTVLVPDADEYLSDSTSMAPTKDTAYYYNNEDAFYKKKNDSENYETVASIDENGFLKIQGQNSLNFSKSYSDYKVNDKSVNVGDIQTDADEVVLEGAFTFSDDYSGNIFSISRDDNSTATVEISIPQALTKKDSDGFVDISSDIDKIKIKNGSYLKIIGNTDKISDTWQDSGKFYNTSIWKRADQTPSGNRINVANFKYAEVEMNQDGLPYPYEDGEILETTTNKTINWNQLFNKDNYSPSVENYGVKFTNNGDGTITIDGKSTATNYSQYLLFGGYSFSITVIKDHKYLFLSHNYSDDNPGFYWVVGGTDNRVFGYEEVSVRGTILTGLESKTGTCYAVLRVVGGNSVSNKKSCPQLFDLTQMFGVGNEPSTVEEFWLYFKTNKVYLKKTYLNISGPYNSYDQDPLKNPINPQQQLFNIIVKNEDKPNEPNVFRCNKTDENPNGLAFNIDQPDKLIWLDYTPTEKQKSVVIDADESDVSTQPMIVMEDKLLKWNDDSSWKDGIYVKNGHEKTLIGQIFVNDEVVKSEYLDATSVEYSKSGLTQQIQTSQNINERKEIINYEFAFRIFVNTNNFSVDQIRSRCYVSPKLPTKGSIITIDEKPYRVLKINNSIAEVLSMYEYQSVLYDDLGDSNIYANSISDTICNVQFYNSLSSQIKDAIVQKAFFQDTWNSKTDAETGALAAYVSTWRNPTTLVDTKETQSLMVKEYGNLLNRYCYLISLQDIIDYLGTTTTMDVTNTTFNADNINSEFFGSFIPHDTTTHKMLLSSAYSQNSFQYKLLSPLVGRIYETSFGVKTYYIRPAFQIDLNKIKWER